MMEIRVPEDCWEEEVDGILSTWLYDTGDRVPGGAVVAQIMVEKVQFDLVAPASGTLRIEADREAVVRKGDLLAYLDEAAG